MMRTFYLWILTAALLSGCGSESSTEAETNSDETSTEETGTSTDTDSSSDESTEDDSSSDDNTNDDSSTDDTSSDETDTDSDETTTDSESAQVNASSDAWVINQSGTQSTYILESNSQGVEVNVQSVTQTTADNENYTYVQATGIPDYAVTMTQELIDSLNSRPKASTDFVGGSTTASTGDVVQFGQDIGFNSRDTCQANAGFGYWPPGPECPENVSHQGYFPNNPQPAATENCETGLGVQGYWVNGTSIYNWGDGQSYNNSGVWQTLAPEAELYDVDICGGHAANGDYHHHFYSKCLADLVGDDGSSHSPIYGFAADGYPIYGPWESDGVLAKSSWVARDYSANSDTGCGSDGVRNCVLVNNLDPAQGTTAASTTGPSTDDQYTSLSGNVFNAESGFFYEDYYWDSNLTGGTYLDQYNGHSDNIRGYHYHVTVAQTDSGTLEPAFPYTVGLEFYGEVKDNSVTNCGATAPGGDTNMPPPRRP